MLVDYLDHYNQHRPHGSLDQAARATPTSSRSTPTDRSCDAPVVDSSTNTATPPDVSRHQSRRHWFNAPARRTRDRPHQTDPTTVQPADGSEKHRRWISGTYTHNGPTDRRHVDTRQFPTANCTASKDNGGQPGESAPLGTPRLKRAPRRPRIAANNGTHSRPPRSAVSLFSLITKPVIDR